MRSWLQFLDNPGGNCENARCTNSSEAVHNTLIRSTSIFSGISPQHPVRRPFSWSKLGHWPGWKTASGRARPRPPLIVISRDSGIKFMDALIAAYNMLSFSRDRQCMSAQLDVGSSNIRVGNNSIFHICCWSSKTQGKNSTEEQLQSLILALMIERLISLTR